jgi:hypothetical protein
MAQSNTISSPGLRKSPLFECLCFGLPSLINTPLQRGVRRSLENKNRFNGFCPAPSPGQPRLLESQRDSVTQPRVATKELPWVNRPVCVTTLKGLRPRRHQRGSSNGFLST